MSRVELFQFSKQKFFNSKKFSTTQLTYSPFLSAQNDKLIRILSNMKKCVRLINSLSKLRIIR